MNIKASYRYQLNDHITSICIYYLAMLFLFIMIFNNMVRMASTNTSSSSRLGSMETFAVIFVFILGLCSFKEIFGLMVQNGISRKTLFLGRLLTTFTIAFGMATIDKIILLIFKFLVKRSMGNLYFTSIYEQLYIGNKPGMGNLSLHANAFLFSFFLYLLFLTIGYFTTLLFYRLNKIGKIAVGVGVPVALFIIFPIIDPSFANGNISKAISEFFDFAFGYSSRQPINAFITCVLGFTLFSGLSWLLLRRVSLKEQ